MTRQPGRFDYRSWNVILAFLLALCLVRMWAMPLPSSFWTDEMATLFVVRQGAADPSFAVAPQVPQSIYYALASLSAHLFGSSEAALRLPSLLAMLAALYFIARVAARLMHAGAAWFVVFGCLTLRGINYQAADARPYALGTCLAAAGVWFLIRWFDAGRWRDAAAFVLCAALLWRVHLMFWPFYLVFVGYAVARYAFRETEVNWARTLMLLPAVGLTLVPVVLQALALREQARLHVIAGLPTARDFVLTVKLGFVAACGVVAFVLHRAHRTGGAASVAPLEEKRFPSPASLVLISLWWLGHPLGLLLFSRLTGVSVFVARYAWPALPGVVLAAAAVASPFLARPVWKPVAVAFGLGVVLLFGGWQRAWPVHDDWDWRLAAQKTNLLCDRTTPIIAPSPFIEARSPAWQPGYPLRSFLYSHLQAYGLQGTIYPFPFENSTQSESFAAMLTRDRLAPSGRFFIFGTGLACEFWQRWFARQPELRGWRSRRLGPFGRVDAVVFESAAPGLVPARH